MEHILLCMSVWNAQVTAGSYSQRSLLA